MVYYIHEVYSAFHGWKSRSCEQLYRKPWVTGSRDRLENTAQMDWGRSLHKTGEWGNWPSLECQGPGYGPVCDRVVTTQCIVWQTEWDKLERSVTYEIKVWWLFPRYREITTKGEKEGHGEAKESHGVVQTHRHRRLGQVLARWGWGQCSRETHFKLRRDLLQCFLKLGYWNWHFYQTTSRNLMSFEHREAKVQGNSYPRKKQIYSLGRQPDRETGGKTQSLSDKGLE